MTILFVAGISGPASSHAQDALRGKRLYLDGGRLNGSGLSCVDCHGGLPGALFGIGKAAHNPSAIEYALGTIGPMAPLRGRLSAADITDLAAYIGNPAAPSPDPRTQVRDAGGATANRERMELTIAARMGTLILINAGKLPLRLLGAPAITGPDERLFTLLSSSCQAGMRLAPQQVCSVEVRFDPDRNGALRVATLSLEHDWVGGALRLALIGRTAAR